jgi:AcrR family transcriptional regulator
MIKAKTRLSKAPSAEEKIKKAAQKLFTQKGYAATRTRDIAEEAGINLALLNYYFRSKKKLFVLVMKENVQLFLGALIENMNNNPRPFEEQLDFVVSHYIDMLLEHPDLPLFILNLMHSGKLDHEDKGDPLLQNIIKIRTTFLKNIQDAMEKGKVSNIHPFHVIANFMGLIIFPFIASSLLMARSGNISRKEFEQLMIERKKLIPKWTKSLMNVN